MISSEGIWMGSVEASSRQLRSETNRAGQERQIAAAEELFRRRRHYAPIMERILNRSTLTNSVALSFVDRKFHSAALARIGSAIRSGLLVLGDDDAGPKSEMLDLLLFNMDASSIKCKAIQLTVKQLSELRGVGARCRKLASLLKRSVSSLECIWIGAAASTRRYLPTTRIEDGADEIEVGVNGVVMLDCCERPLTLHPQAVQPIENLFATVSSLLSGKCGRLETLEKLVVQWPIHWGFECGGMRAPTLASMLSAAPHLRIVHLDQGQVEYKELEGGNFCASHPLYIDANLSPPIAMSSLERITFGFSFHRWRVLAFRKRRIVVHPLLSHLLRAVDAPMLRRVGFGVVDGDGDVWLEHITEIREENERFPALHFDDIWIDARPEQRRATDKSSRRPAARSGAAVLRAYLNATPATSTTPIAYSLLTERDETALYWPSRDGTHWFDTSGLVKAFGGCVAVAQGTLNQLSDFGDAATRRRLVVVVVGHRENCDDPCPLYTASPLMASTAITLVVQSLERRALCDVIERLELGMRHRVDKVIFNWRVYKEHVQERTKLGPWQFNSRSWSCRNDEQPGKCIGSAANSHASVIIERLRALLPRLRRLQIVLQVDRSTKFDSNQHPHYSAFEDDDDGRRPSKRSKKRKRLQHSLSSALEKGWQLCPRKVMRPLCAETALLASHLYRRVTISSSEGALPLVCRRVLVHTMERVDSLYSDGSVKSLYALFRRSIVGSGQQKESNIVLDFYQPNSSS